MRIEGQPAGSLCLDCGLCCDSGLFGYFELKARDRAALANAGIEAPERIEQPCRFFTGCCTIYADRPQVCRNYRCELLKKLDDRDVEPETAKGIVRTARAHHDRLLAAFPPDTTAKDMGLRLEATMGSEKADLALLAAWTVYRLYVERHFLETRKWTVRKPLNPPSESGRPVP